MKLAKLITLALSCTMTLAAEQKEATGLSTEAQEFAEVYADTELKADEGSNSEDELSEDEEAASQSEEDSESDSEELAQIDEDEPLENELSEEELAEANLTEDLEEDDTEELAEYRTYTG